MAKITSPKQAKITSAKPKTVLAKQSQRLENLKWEGSLAKECQNAKLVLDTTHKTASSLLDAYERIRKDRLAAITQKERKSKAGTTTDQEQDILRAMLVMATAGLDGGTKQFIRDTMPSLIAKNETIRSGLITFIERQVRGDIDTQGMAGNPKFIARLLAAPSHQKQAIEEYIDKLTSGSLQSARELLQVGQAFALKETDIYHGKQTMKEVQKIFNIRNKIIHELDMNLEGKPRKRTQRKMQDMRSYVNTLLAIGVSLINKVSQKVSAGPEEQGDISLSLQ
jgi:hypothetical protein